MTSDVAIFNEPHHQALELLSAKALASGDIASAFKLSDRRCRIAPLAEPHCFVLRADALYRMGRKEDALADILRAIEIAPDDIAANRRLMAWSDGSRREDAALTLITQDGNHDTLRQAIAVLRSPERGAFASAKLVGSTIRGWAAWPRDRTVEVAISAGRNAVASALVAEPAHPLADVLGHAANLVLPPPASDEAQLITVSCDGETLVSIRRPAENEPRQDTTRRGGHIARARSARRRTSEPQATVIVPIYADYEATKACIDSLLAHSSDRARWRVMLVNDASPDAAINDYLAGIAKDRHVGLLSNDANLGFVGSVNRALAEISCGDILLLNADTIVPEGFLDRVAVAAHSSPAIGTVTPVSNNGEFTSFPVANAANPLPPLAEIAMIDRVAAEVNAGRVVTIPNGIGFCLYVTRACLDAVGALSSRYHRGYLEDVDFCLRARERGFRNVCAPSIYVGHVGSRSFGREKRSLVVRNLAIIEQRFPHYRAECAAFVALDPLRESRQAIELAMPLLNRAPRLVVTGEGAVAAVARERARNLASLGQETFVLSLRRRPGGTTLKITNASAAAPQSIAFDLGAAGDMGLLAYVGAVKPSRLEIADPANVPPALLDRLTGLGIRCDILIADAGLLGDEGGLGEPLRTRLPAARRSEAANPCEVEGASVRRTRYLREIVAKADRLFVPCPQAHAFVVRHFPPGAAERIEIIDADVRPQSLPEQDSHPQRSRHRLGIVPIEAGPQQLEFMRNVACAFNTRCPECSIVILGNTLDDLALMRIGNAFVTGPLGASELDRACRNHELGTLFLCTTRPLFGHPLQFSAQACGLPLAYFDWCGTTRRPAARSGRTERRADRGADPVGRELLTCKWQDISLGSGRATSRACACRSVGPTNECCRGSLQTRPIRPASSWSNSSSMGFRCGSHERMSTSIRWRGRMSATVAMAFLFRCEMS
jgi:GT2 family glycosyltransferase